MCNSIELNVNRLLSYCNGNYDKKEELTLFISNYFLERISTKKIYSKEEFEEVKNLVQFLKRYYTDEEKKKNCILIKARDLWLYSLDCLNGSDNYDKVCKCEYNFNDGYDSKEFLEYIKILLDNASDYMTLGFLKKQINFYISKDNFLSDNNRLLNLVVNHPNFSLLDGDIKIEEDIIKTLRNAASKKYASRLYKSFSKSLNKDKICCDDIIDYIGKVEETIEFKFDVEIYSDLKKKINDFLYDRYAIVKFDTDADYYKVQKALSLLVDRLDGIKNKESMIRDDICSGKIVLKMRFPRNVPINHKFDRLNTVVDSRIIAIDDIISSDLDTAFSINEIDGNYIFDVYVSDVPNFLKYNEQLSKVAYERGNSLYIRDGRNSQISIDMLPYHLSHKCLSLNLDFPINVIDFSFVISSNGEIYSKSISRKRIKLTHRVTPKQADLLINSDEFMGDVQCDLKKYKELCRAVIESSEDYYLKMLKADRIPDLVAFSSILVNYYIGHEAEFAIYRVGGKYTDKANIDCYTHSVTPIRKFVSNINLAFFLEQKGVTSFYERDLVSIQENKEEIIHHLNETDEFMKFTNNNQAFVKKYIKY